MESVHKALNPLVSFTDALSGEADVSVLQFFNGEVLRPQDDDTELTKAIKTTIYLNEKYDDAATDDLLNMAILDPRSRRSTSRPTK